MADSIICKIFGHDMALGYMGGLPYFTVSSYSAIDGLNTEHLTLLNRCERCGKEIAVGKLHMKPPRTPEQIRGGR